MGGLGGAAILLPQFLASSGQTFLTAAHHFLLVLCIPLGCGRCLQFHPLSLCLLVILNFDGPLGCGRGRQVEGCNRGQCTRRVPSAT